MGGGGGGGGAGGRGAGGGAWFPGRLNPITYKLTLSGVVINAYKIS